jgi:cytochrome c oxidase assembly protein subunit 15
MYRNLVFLALALAFVVVVFGAYVRLNDAGLGCPDWPGCYGHATVPQPDTMRATAAAKFPGAGLEPRKAWIEMIHRYLAGTLGLLILALAILAWRRRMRPGATTGVRRIPWLQTILVVLVAFQAALGMWTVTLLLKPAIVTLHLVGGMLTLSVLVWLAMRELPWRPLPGYETAARLRPWTVLALVVVCCQIVLGGWVSTNYAALACSDFPTCHGTFAPPADYAHGFHVLRELGMSPEGVPLSNQALNAIHWAHRLGAVLTLLLVGGVALVALRVKPLRSWALLVLAALGIQIGIGVSNVVFLLPLWLAVAHNAGAAFLLTSLLMLNFRLSHAQAFHT